MKRNTSRLAVRIGVSLVLVLGFGGCKDTPKGVEAQVPPDVAAAMKAEAPAHAAPAAAAPVDVCALFTAEDFKAVTGEEPAAPGRANPAQGSMLGDCMYAGKKVPMLSISARPAHEYDRSIKYLRDGRDDLEDLAGVGDGAVFAPKTGMLVKYSGRPYLLQVLPMKEIGTFDRDLSIAIGTLIAGKQ